MRRVAGPWRANSYHAGMARTIRSVRPVIGLEIHVELGTRTKMFSRAANGAHPSQYGAEPNTLIDPVVLGLPGALPVMNKAAVEMSMMVGLALGCQVAAFSRWDRKSYFYPDLPKNYQISQYQLPLCFDGAVDLPAVDAKGEADFEAESTRIGIIRAHLEEDAGKLLHEAPGGGKLDYSIADYNRAGTPLLEIVTRPDFTSSDQVVLFCRVLRNLCRFLGVSEGVLQRGHIRFEPNINGVLTLDDGHTATTPITEVKNLNSYKAVKGAIEFELREQVRRWQETGVEMTPGSKSTRGWDDAAGETFLQREKEEAHDYRYFPDPDLVPVSVSPAWLASVKARVVELPLSRLRRYAEEYGLTKKEAAALVDERDVCLFYEAVIEAAVTRGVGRERAGKLAANLVLQSGAKRANERTKARQAAHDEGGATGASVEPVLVSGLGISADAAGGIVRLRDEGSISAQGADELFGLLCEPGNAGMDAAELASARGLVIVRDEGALDAWCDQVIAANAKVAEDVRGGKQAAVGRLVGEVMKLSGGKAEAKSVRERLLGKLGA
jgi:aspartyl-tRNA(Asn)/glutamyl-tRNA(Gln) amidotransferase subunit B